MTAILNKETNNLADYDLAGAQELLEGAVRQDANPEQSAPAPEPQPSSEVEPGAAVAPVQSDSFTNINPDDLPEELQPLAKQLQGAFTQKTQALAEQRKALEQLGDIDPAQALEAYQFVNALQNDPQYALRVHQELTRALQAEGLSLGEAQQAAAQAMTPEESVPDVWSDGEEEFYGAVPPEVQQQLDQMRSYMEQQQAAQAQQAQAAEFFRQEQTIRQMHPEYTEGDMDRIAHLAVWHGDLFKAADEYGAMRDEFASTLLAQKRSVPSAAPSGAAQGQAVQPNPITDLDQAQAAGMEMLRAAGLTN